MTMLRLHFRFKTSIDFSCETCIFRFRFLTKTGKRVLDSSVTRHSH